jgi:AraC-like DNA-binding protein
MRISRRAPQLEIVPAVAAQSFAVLEQRSSHFRFLWHRHPEWELTLIIGGEGTRFVGDHVEAYCGGDLCLVGPDVPHSWSSSPSPGFTARAIVVQFHPRVVATLAALPEGARIAKLLARADGGMAWPVSRLAVELRSITSTHEGLPRLLLLLGVLDHLAMARGRPLASHIPSSVVDRRLHRVLGLVEDRLAGPISQRAVAQAAGMTAGAFSRFFHRVTGRTFVRYVAERRIARCCRDLMETDDRVLDIALGNGFGSIAAFNRCFRTVKGTTPRAFRRMGAR